MENPVTIVADTPQHAVPTHTQPGMRLIGMLDSPYVRRVAISLRMLDIPFAYEAISVFSTFARFQSINPVVKAPTLVCDNGEVLMDSTLILQYIESISERSLWSTSVPRRQNEFRAVSLALAACEKSVQIVYEKNLRPASAQYQPWLERVRAQLLAAYAGLEHEVQTRPSIFAVAHSHASVTAAVVWQFTQSTLANIVAADAHPGLAALSARMELLPEFVKYPPLGSGITPTYSLRKGHLDG